MYIAPPNRRDPEDVLSQNKHMPVHQGFAHPPQQSLIRRADTGLLYLLYFGLKLNIYCIQIYIAPPIINHRRSIRSRSVDYDYSNNRHGYNVLDDRYLLCFYSSVLI